MCPRRSCRRELMFNFEKTLLRCHSTVRGLMNRRTAISTLERPSPASRATWASCGVRLVCASTVRGRTVSPVAVSSSAVRLAKASISIAVNISCAMWS